MLAALRAHQEHSAPHKQSEHRLTHTDQMKIRVERMALVMRGAPLGFTMSIIGAMIAYYCLRSEAGQAGLLAWTASVVAGSIAAGLFWLRLRRRDGALGAHAIESYARFHIVWMSINGVLWGALAPICAVYGLLNSALVPILIAGMSLAALASSGASWRAVLAFSAPALIPLVVVYAVAGAPSGAAVAALVAIYAAMSAYIAWITDQLIARSIRYRSRNTQLLDALRKQVESARDRERLYRGMVEASQDITLVFTPEGEIRYASPAVRDALGVEPSGLVGRTTRDILHPEDLRVFQTAGAKALSTLGEATPLTHVCLKSAEQKFIPFSGKLTNMLYVPGVEGFVFSGGVDRRKVAAPGHAAE